MNQSEIAEYPVSHALALLDLTRILRNATEMALSLPVEPISSVEAKNVAEQLKLLVKVLASRGIFVDGTTC